MEMIYHFPEKNDLQFGPQMFKKRRRPSHAPPPLPWSESDSAALHATESNGKRAAARSPALSWKNLTSKLWLVGG
jgi:hypothetical protein